MKNLSFKLRKNGKGLPVIEVHLNDSRFKHRRFKYSTGRFIDPSQWDKRKQRSSDKFINQHLDFITGCIKDFLNLHIQDKALSREALKSYILSQMGGQQDGPKEKDLFEVWEEIINTSKSPKGQPVKKLTMTQKCYTMNKVKEFLSKKGIKLTFLNLNMVFYHQFDAWMIEQGLNGNSRGKHFKEIKAILREAHERDIPVSKDYEKKGWRIIKEKVDDIYLTYDDIQKLLDVELTGNREIIRDWFVMACFVGVRVSDWHQIWKTSIVTERGKDMFRLKQQKTTEFVHVPVHPLVRMILNKYDKKPKIITEQNINENLKLIGQQADLGKCIWKEKECFKWEGIRTHTARRTFATNAYLSKSMQTIDIMRLTGHKSESSFLIYLKLNNVDHAVIAAESKFFTEEWPMLKVV